MHDLDLAAHIAAALRDAPPLTDAQRHQIAHLLARPAPTQAGAR